MKHETIFHADDYGATMNVSRDIIDCIRNGVVNSVSIIPNSDCLEEAIDALKPFRECVKTSVHLNIAEGRALSPRGELRLLTNEEGYFTSSFFGVLMLSISPKRGELKAQLKKELGLQIDRLAGVVSPLRIDSHQHYHMIPVVLEAILDVSRERNLEIEFIRIPVESFIPLLKSRKLFGWVKPINVIKNLVLAILSLLNARTLKKYNKTRADFTGILMTSGMYLERVALLYPEYKRLADAKGRPLELLAHPGGESDIEMLMDKNNIECVNFYTSDNRHLEKEMFQGIVTKMLQKL